MGFFDFVGDIFEAAAPIAGIVDPRLGNILQAGAGAFDGDEATPAKKVAAASGALGNIQGSKLITPGKKSPGQIFEEVAAGNGGRVAVSMAATGSLRRRTIVETFNPRTGAVSKRETLKGAPAVMQSDVAAANRLNRALRRLNKKQPKKLVRESEMTALKNEVVNSALRRARDPCPPKPCP